MTADRRPGNAQVQLWIDRVVEFCGRAISTELVRELRRARRSEAEMDATIRAQRALLGRCAMALDLAASLRGVGKYRASGDFLVAGDAYQTTHASVKATLAALRSAGVEPTP